MLLLLLACTSSPPGDTSASDTGTMVVGDGGAGDGGGADADGGTDGGGTGVNPFAASIRRYEPGEGAGFGQDQLPDVVLGSPEGGGKVGSLDVLSLGREGVIELGFDGVELVDGEGPDLLVFENPFPGWYETGVVAVSEDGETWWEWPCASADAEGMYPGCAGVGLVWATSDNGLDATDPAVAGGDAFDLADLGLARARFVRVRDSGANSYDGVAGGFDLDAIAAVHLALID